jgi:nucleotide-binding universal stress UspA family protein
MGMDQDEPGVSPLRIGHVLLPLDGSEFAAAALHTARALCDRFGADLTTISVASDERDVASLREHATGLVGGDGDDGRRQVRVATDVASAIVACAAELGSSVVCMSTRGRGRVAGAVIGSVTRDVLQRSDAPVVSVGPQADRPPALVGRPRRRPASWPEPLAVRRLVACVDGSAASETVLPVAAQWAAALDMSLTILTVAEDAPRSLGGGRPANRFGPPDPHEYVERLAAQWTGPDRDVVGRVVHSALSVASGVDAHVGAEPAGLVAITTHARTGFHRIRMGATAADIVRTSTLPTLVVPVPQTAMR